MFTVVPDKNVGDVFTQAMWATYLEANLNSGVDRPLFDTTLASAAASINVTSIPATFAHLMFVFQARGDTAAADVAATLRLNGDTGANYDFMAVYNATAASITGSESFAVTSIAPTLGTLPAATAPASTFGSLIVTIPNYAGTVANKSVHCDFATKIGTSTGNMYVIRTSAFWRSTAAVNQLTILAGAGNFIIGSRLTVYGMGYL